MPWAVRMALMVSLGALLIQWYVARRTTSSLAKLGFNKVVAKRTAIVIVIWLMLYPLLLIAGYLTGVGRFVQMLQRSSPLLDAALVYPFWVGVVVTGQLGLAFLAIDLGRLLLWPFYRRRRNSWQKWQARTMVLLAGVCLVYSVVRIYLDTFTVRSTETEIHAQNLPSELEGFRIVQIADIQVDTRTNGKKLDVFIEEVNRLKPDLILFGGDLITSGTDFIETGAQAAGRLESRYGVYACLGDHDFFSNRQMVVDQLEKNGVTVLDNLATVVPVGSSHISLTGITNVYRMRPPPGRLDIIEQDRSRGPVNVLLTHQPSPWLVDFARSRGYDLFLAGHTHGGQVALRLPGLLLAGSSFETPYVTGFHQVGTMLVSVTNGLGLTLAPIRYNAPAEVTLLVLKNGSQNGIQIGEGKLLK